MAIRLRIASAASQGTAATNFPATLPVGWQPGDIAFVMIRIGTSVTQSWSQSAGTGTWTQQYAAADANGGYGYAVYWRVLQAGDTNPTFSWATTSTSYTWVQVSFFSDAAGVLSIDGWAAELDTSVAANTVTPNAVTASSGGRCSVILASARTQTAGSATTYTYTPPSGWTEPASGDAFRLAANSGFSGCCYQLGVSGSVAPGNLSLTDDVAHTFFFSAAHALIQEYAPAVQQPPPPPNPLPGFAFPISEAVFTAPLGAGAVNRNLYNNFEGITPSGTTLTQGSGGNTGGLSGDFFDTLLIGSGATLISDSAHSHGGSLSMQCATSATAAQCFAAWGATSLAPSPLATPVFFRMYGFMTAFPSVNWRLISWTSSGTACASVVITTLGLVRVQNSAGTAIGTGTVAIPVNTWFRLEGWCIGDPAIGQVEYRLFKVRPEADINSYDEIGTFTNVTALGPISQLRIGQSAGAIASYGPVWFDDVGGSTQGYLGPAPPANLIPQQYHRQVPGRVAPYISTTFRS